MLESCRNMDIKMYISAVVISILLGQAEAAVYSSLCQDFYSFQTSRQNFDVTDDSHTILSHEGGYHYPISYSGCFHVWTNKTDYVIKLEEDRFEIEHSYSCLFDYLEIFYSSVDDANLFDAEGKWCGSDGPGTKYSESNRMFLYFHSDSSGTEQGFKFTVSSIHKDDVPIQLSAGVIVGIVLGVIVIIILIIVIVGCVMMHKKKPGSVQPNGHPRPQVHGRQNVAVVSHTRTVYNQPRTVGYMPPPTYQQQPPPYTQGGYNQPPPPANPTGPVGQPQDPVYPPPPALYNSPTTQPQNNGINNSGPPPPPYGAP